MPSKQALDYGKLGSKYGDRGGRPSSKGKPLGMATIEYDEIVAFLNSKQSAPIYPSRMVGGSSRSKIAKEKQKYSRNKNKRKEFRKKCTKFTVHDGILHRLVKFASEKKKKEGEENDGIMFKARVAKRGEVNDDLFYEFHNEKGHNVKAGRL